MSFLEITDLAKRDSMVAGLHKTKKKIQENALAEKLGDIGLQRDLTKLYKPITELQSALTAAVTKELGVNAASTTAALKALPSQLRAIRFPNYPSIEAGTDDSLKELRPIAVIYLRST